MDAEVPDAENFDFLQDQDIPKDLLRIFEDKVKLSGILRDKTMADKMMYIPNDDTQNLTICRLQLVVETIVHSTKLTNQSNFTKVSKVVKSIKKKTLL